MLCLEFLEGVVLVGRDLTVGVGVDMRKQPLPTFLLLIPFVLRLPACRLARLFLILNPTLNRTLDPIKGLIKVFQLLPKLFIGNVLHGNTGIDRHGGGYARGFAEDHPDGLHTKRREGDMAGRDADRHEQVGLAAYGVDDWPYAVVVEDGKVAVQGGAFSIVYLDNGKYNGSYKIPYEAILPRKGECDNLLVPVCVSASHIAFTSLRMEPVWMVLGESAGVAAAMAVDAGIPVQDVPYKQLRQKLEDLDQTLDRIQGPIQGRVQDQKKPGKSASWKSQDEWNQQKKGWEWLFPHIDTDSDGQISADEYNAFQKFKAEHDDWEESLKTKGALTPTGLLSRDRPNIVLIFADDLGIETLNAYGGHGVRTPHLDKLATGGMLFTHCFANPACSPSRAEIMTGTYPGFTGIKHVLSKWEDDTYLDPKKFNSFANQLKKAGYATAIAGKWNLSWLERNDTVRAFGFDESCLWQMYDRNGMKRSRYYKPHFA